MDLSSVRQQFDVPGVEFGMRCGFCNGLEEAEGTLGIELAPGQFGVVPIGENCLNIVSNISNGSKTPTRPPASLSADKYEMFKQSM